MEELGADSISFNSINAPLPIQLGVKSGDFQKNLKEARGDFLR